MLQLLKLKELIFNRYFAALCIVIGAVIYHLMVVSSLEADLTECTEKGDKLSKRITELTVASELQSSEIDRWFKANQSYSKIIEDINNKNVEERKRFTTIINKLKDAPIPVDCDGAIRHLQSTVIELSDEWDKK